MSILDDGALPGKPGGSEHARAAQEAIWARERRERWEIEEWVNAPPPYFPEAPEHQEARIVTEWDQRAPVYADWTTNHLVNRTDCYGQYRPLDQRAKGTAFTVKGSPTDKVLRRHFAGKYVSNIVGLHSTAVDKEGASWSKWLVIDYDRKKEEDDAGANWRAARAAAQAALDLGLNPVIEDSNGWGAYHVWCVFRDPVPTRDVHRLGKYLARDWKKHGLPREPEIFPKQPGIDADGYGNWMRLPGRHHCRAHWSRFWDLDQECWLEGADAVDYMTQYMGSHPYIATVFMPPDPPPAAEPPAPEPPPAAAPHTPKFVVPDPGDERIWGMTVPATNDADTWLGRALVNAAGRVANSQEGDRHIAVIRETRTLAGYLHYGRGFSEEELIRGMTAAADRVDPDRKDNAKTVLDAVGYGKALPLTLKPELHALTVEPTVQPDARRNGRHDGNRNGTASGGPPGDSPPTGQTDGESGPPGDEYVDATDAELGVIDAADVVLENPVWSWNRRFLKGKINLVAGEGGDGKTTVAIGFASVVLMGGTFPDGTQAGPPGLVMFLGAEDGAGDTIKPRFIAAGADLSTGRLKFLTASVSIPKRGNRPAMVHPLTLKDTAYWRAIFKRHRPAVLIIDPLPAYLGRGVNDNRNSDVQAALNEFAKVATEFGVCVVAITHTGKATDRKLIHKVLGSVAYTNVARVVHVTVRDPDDPNVRYLERAKCNLDEPVDALVYKLVSAEFEQDGRVYKTSRAVLEADAVAIDAEAMANPKKGPKRGFDAKVTPAVAEWLFDFLTSQGSATPLAAVFDAAGEAGHAGAWKDGKWGGVGTLYNAMKLIPQLPAPRDGKRVEPLEIQIKPGGRHVKHWYLCSAGAAF